MSEDPKRYNLAEIRTATAVLFADVKFGAGECVEVRVIDKKKHLVAAGWFDDVEALAKTVARLARDGFGTPGTYRHVHENVYWTCNPVHDALLARQPKNTIDFVADTTSDSSITRRLWLPIDIDPLRPSGVSATKAERNLALEVVNILIGKLVELGFPEIVGGTSGNGYHVLIRIDLPNDNGSRDLLKKCLAALQEMVGTGKVEVDPKVYNASRIIKCYGTVSCKGVNTEDRPWRWSRLTLVPDKIEIVSRELLEKLAALAPDKNNKRDIGQKRQVPCNVGNAQAYIDWTPWDCGDQLAGGKPGETAKWLGPCIADENHKDAALILHDDRWWSFTCFHPQCEMSHKAFMAHWEEVKGEKYLYPGARPETWDSSAGFGVEGANAGIPEAEEKTELTPFNPTDMGNTERLIHRFGHLFRYCPEKD